jgi:hypothetical protein
MKCILCADTGWVCENHPRRPWDGPYGCDCGGAGALPGLQHGGRRRCAQAAGRLLNRRRQEGLAPLALRSGPANSKHPIILADGRKLVTVRDAATYITKLPKAEQDLQIWQIAVEHLIRAAETGGGWTRLASIGVLQALHRDRDAYSTPIAKRRIGARGS